jgi:glycerophosphoryl diester phosphodiesterase
MLLLSLISTGSLALQAQIMIKPGIAHNLNKTKFIEVYGHRGARGFAPENTIPAYRTGLQVGVDWVDMDIVLSKDGVIMVAHDLWLNPDIVSTHDGKFWAASKSKFIQNLSGPSLESKIAPYLVHNLTVAQLQSYNVGKINPLSPYADYFPQQVARENTVLPSLQEVINYVEKWTNYQRKINYQIEIKDDPAHPQWTAAPAEFAAKLYALLKKNRLLNRVEVQSFDWQCLYELQKLDQQIKTAYLVGYDDKQRMLDPDPQLAGLWSGGKLLKNYNNSLPHMVKALGGSCFEPEDVTLSQEELKQAHALGLKVVVWGWPEHQGTAFDANLYAKLISWGVDGIITDDPARLNSMLAARGYRVPQNYPVIR